MSTTTTYPTSTTSGLQANVATMFANVASYLGRFAEGAREGRTIAARYQELSQLSRTDLASRGLDRQGIARAALTGR